MQSIPSHFDFFPVPCLRFDEPDAITKCKVVQKVSSSDPSKVTAHVYEGTYDLKYYLDRQASSEKNTHLTQGRVLVFVVYRKKTDIPIADVIVSEKFGK